MKDRELSEEMVLAMATAAIAEEEGFEIKRVRVVSFRRIRKTALEQYIEDHAIAYKKFVLPTPSVNN